MKYYEVRGVVRGLKWGERAPATSGRTSYRKAGWWALRTRGIVAPVEAGVRAFAKRWGR